MIWGRRKHDREQRLAEAKQAAADSAIEVQESRATLHYALAVSRKIRGGRERNHYSQVLEDLIERGRA